MADKNPMAWLEEQVARDRAEARHYYRLAMIPGALALLVVVLGVGSAVFGRG